MSKINKVKTEPAAGYAVDTIPSTSGDEVIHRALRILKQRLREFGVSLTSPDATRNYLTLSIADREAEVFGCLFLNNQHQLIEDEHLFFGTVDAASVYPREVVKRALQLNAAAVIFYHNHPSGLCEPSQADKNITDKLKAGLTLVDIRVIDHIIVAGMDTYSFAEHSLV